ncbi:MAG: hypothetical protein HOP02_07395 [Methylococcaceae bacterium]|nr:hypothetical protein [Methylococcaceae bacterium]
MKCIIFMGIFWALGYSQLAVAGSVPATIVTQELVAPPFLPTHNQIDQSAPKVIR